MTFRYRAQYGANLSTIISDTLVAENIDIALQMLREQYVQVLSLEVVPRSLFRRIFYTA